MAANTPHEYWRNRNPHDYEVKPANLLVHGEIVTRFYIVDKDGEPIQLRKLFSTHDEASDAIGKLIADDDEDRHLHRNRHEPGADEPPAEQRFGPSEGASSAGRR